LLCFATEVTGIVNNFVGINENFLKLLLLLLWKFESVWHVFRLNLSESVTTVRQIWEDDKVFDSNQNHFNECANRSDSRIGICLILLIHTWFLTRFLSRFPIFNQSLESWFNSKFFCLQWLHNEVTQLMATIVIW
jgi:hypothetical protein